MAGHRGSDQVSKMIDDDEDDSLSILDSLEEDDPFRDLNEKQESPSRSHRPKPPEKASQASDSSFDRVQYYRALQGFLQALVESAPLYIGERQRNPGISDADLRRRVAAFCKRHLSLIDKCLEINEADPADMMLRYQRRSLAKQIASLYKIAPIEELETLVDVARDWTLDSSDFDNTGIEYTSSDNMLNVKLALFSSALKAQVGLKGLWGAFTPSEVISKLQSIALSLAKEVAFGWSKRCQISDQDNLFMAALPHCLEIAELAYKDMLIKDLPEIEYIPSDPGFSLTQFEKALEAMDMGYVGQPQVELVARMRSLASKYLDDAQMPNLSLVDGKRWQSAYISKMDEIFAMSWSDSTDEFFEQMEKLDISQREEFAKDNELMNLTGFMARVMEHLTDLECPLVDTEVDFDRILDRSRRHLAWVWGISDSLIAARNEELPGDFA